MKEYYYYDGQEQKGPVTIDELKKLSLKRETKLWCQGMPEWKHAEELDDFKEFFLSIPPPMSSPKTTIDNVSSQVANNDVSKGKSARRTAKVVLGAAIAIVLAIGIYGYIQNTKDEIVNETLQEAENEHQEEETEKARLEDIKKKEIRNNILTYVDSKTTYDVAAFGGISNVQIHFYNNTDYSIDEAIVRVTYIKANGGVWTTMDVTLDNISAKGSSVERSQNTDRGETVQTEILSIKCSALNLCFNGVRGGEDPYLCL